MDFYHWYATLRIAFLFVTSIWQIHLAQTCPVQWSRFALLGSICRLRVTWVGQSIWQIHMLVLPTNWQRVNFSAYGQTCRHVRRIWKLSKCMEDTSSFTSLCFPCLFAEWKESVNVSRKNNYGNSPSHRQTVSHVSQPQWNCRNS